MGEKEWKREGGEGKQGSGIKWTVGKKGKRKESEAWERRSGRGREVKESKGAG